MTDAKEPERIWAYSWTGKEGRQGQWDYIDTSHYYGSVFEYIRADLHVALAKERDELQSEVERLRDLVNRAAEIFTNCNVTDGTCCCGDSMENHSHPMHCGHSPVDHGGYVVDQWMEDYDVLQHKEGNE